MWTRTELKDRAKKGLKQYYWYGLLAIAVRGVIISIISTIAGFLLFFAVGLNLIISIFVTNVIAVGICSYYIKSTREGKGAGIEEVFGGFQNHYLRIVGIQFIRMLFTFFWTLLLIIPGIIKAYEYFMVPYLAAEYPEKDRKEIFQMSKQMMDGNKFKTWVLQLSFIGWMLLGILACGIGIVFVCPYIEATFAELYLKIKEERLGIPRKDINTTGDSGDVLDQRVTGKRVAQIGWEARNGFLIGIQGGFSGANIPVEPGRGLMIGADPTRCNVVIQGKQVSPLHLNVRYDSKTFIVTDFSEEGTFNLQQGRLQRNVPVSLQPETYLQIGSGGDIFCLKCR